MQTVSRSNFSTVKTEGAILPADLLQRVHEGAMDGMRPQDYHLAPNERLRDAISRSWNRLRGVWQSFDEARRTLDEADSGTSLTRERWLLILFDELGYGRLPFRGGLALGEDGDRYPISHEYEGVPIHLVSFRQPLDRSEAGQTQRRRSPHSLLQEYLNRSEDALWGFAANGLQLRVLRDNASLTRAAFLEFDLEAMMAGELFADFSLLWLVCHVSRVERGRGGGNGELGIGSGEEDSAPTPHSLLPTPSFSWLERWSQTAAERGTRALDSLRDGVQEAIEALGRGYLAHPGNEALRDRLRVGALAREAYYRELLRLVYRLIFLFVAEDRDLLLLPDADPAARQRYTDYYAAGRLRDLAAARRGGAHPDLYRGLRLVFDKLREGYPPLGLPALGGFLFSGRATPELDAADIANEALLEAVRALAFTIEGRVLRPVDYRNLGAEELGSVYESLLELHPQMDAAAATFSLRSAAGSERKTTGSYYTPTSLINSLLDSALRPVIADRLGDKRGAEAEAALLDIKVVDPASGSGHFLIAAANVLAQELARIRTGDAEPSPADRRDALRDVAGRCLYGVDLNEMAVELCKVSLWLETLDPGKPLSFLDHHIRHGNSLIGATPALLREGIPDEAFMPLTGDDKAYVSEWKKRNRKERDGQAMLPLDAAPWLRLGDFAAAVAALEDAPDDTPAAVRAKEAAWERLVSSGEYENNRLLADAWCAAFVFPKNYNVDFPISENDFRDIERNPHSVPRWMKDEIVRLRERYRFFHWHLAFPEVFSVMRDGVKRDGVKRDGEMRDGEMRDGVKRDGEMRDGVMRDDVMRDKSAPDHASRLTPHASRLTLHASRFTNHESVTGWSGGFDVVLGNPPWERIKLQEKEWFAARDADIAAAPNAAARGRMIAALQQENPTVYRDFLDDRRAAEGESHIARNSGRYPLCGRGDVNTYTLFAELARHLTGPRGRAGIIVPSGIATDDTTKFYFQDIVSTGALASLYDFENREAIFPGVHRSYKFCLLTLRGVGGGEWGVGEYGSKGMGEYGSKGAGESLTPSLPHSPTPSSPPPAEFVFFALNTADLSDPERRFTPTAAEIALLNPNTRTCPIFRSKRDAELTKAIYRRVPVLIREGDPDGNPWGISFLRMFDMANDSGLFRTRVELERWGYQLVGNRFVQDTRYEIRDTSEERSDHRPPATGHYLPLYEAKMLHHFDHRWATYEGGDTRDVTAVERDDPAFVIFPRYWVSVEEVNRRVGESWKSNWLLGWRKIARSTDIRTFISSIFPVSGYSDSGILGFPDVASSELGLCLLGNLASMVLDYVVRQKLGGTNMAHFISQQLPIIKPTDYLVVDLQLDKSPKLIDWILRRALELTYTAWDLRPFAQDCGYHGPPFRWDEARRFLIRCELDAAYFHLYGIARDDVDYIMDTFPIVRRKDEAAHGEYRTKRVILEMYDWMAERMGSGEWGMGNREWGSGGVGEDALTPSFPYSLTPFLSPPPGDPRAAHPWDEAWLGAELPAEEWWEEIRNYELGIRNSDVEGSSANAYEIRDTSEEGGAAVGGRPSVVGEVSPTYRARAASSTDVSPAEEKGSRGVGSRGVGSKGVGSKGVGEEAPTPPFPHSPIPPLPIPRSLFPIPPHPAPTGPRNVRLRRAMELGKDVSPAATAELVAFLADADSSIRWLAGSTLAQRADAAGVVAAIEAFARAAEAERVAVARPEMARVLEMIMDTAGEESVRAAAGRVMGEM